MSLPPLFLDPHAEAEPTEGRLFGPKPEALQYQTNLALIQNQDLLWQYADGRTADVASTAVLVGGVGGAFVTDANTRKLVRPAIRFPAYQVKDVNKFGSIRNESVPYPKHDIYVVFGAAGTEGPGVSYYDNKTYVGRIMGPGLNYYPGGCLDKWAPQMDTMKKRCVADLQILRDKVAPALKDLKNEELAPANWNAALKDDNKAPTAVNRRESIQTWLQVVRAVVRMSFPNPKAGRA